MTSNTQDQWAQWLLHRRFGGDLQHGPIMLKKLAVWRNRILEHATVAEGETVQGYERQAVAYLWAVKR